MNNRENLINSIVDDKPVRLRESYFINNFNKEHSIITEFCINIPDIPFKQKIWHWINDIDSYYLCDCGKRTKFNKNWKDGYKDYCSAKCAQSSSKTKEKRRKTNIEKYGVDNVAKNSDIKKKTEKTNLERYGHKSTFQNEKVREKWKDTILEKYGVDHYFKTDEFKIKAKKYYLEKWGVEHQLDVEEIKERIKQTCLKKYGVSTYLNTEHSRSSIKKYNRSSYEKDICDWLDSIGVSYITNNRNVIKPLSIDIYIEDYNLAIEFNGLYWHSELFKDKSYHLNKTNLCNEKGIQLIHIWEDDWLSRKDVIKSMILNKVGKIDNRVYGRKCEVREVNNKDTSDFLNKCHIQGYTRFSNSIGLYYNDELVSLMSFGWRSINAKKEYELIRFCNKLNTSVIGAASKLFKHFIKNNEIDQITSYADISMFNGNLYTKLGFEYNRRSDINYWWVVKGVRKHRFNYNKRKLVKKGYDPLKTEVEIMHELGNYRIYGCGQDKYIWSR